MSAQTKKLAILFADISGSTALYEKLGDQLARQLIARCLTILNGPLLAHKGTLIKTIGDEILCTFPTAEAALIAACEMQRAIKADNQISANPLYIRIGFNYGDVICEDGDIFGDAVNVASRVAAITRSGQIMTTPAVINPLPLALHDQVRKIQRVDIKGKQEQIDIYQVMWELEDMCSTRIGLPTYRKPQAEGNELLLKYRDQSYKIDEQNMKLLLGRDDNCQIVVKSDFASRQHAHVEFKAGNFMLSDHSSNATYIRNSEGKVTHLNRQDTVLQGKGSISLGQPFSDNSGDLIEFHVTPKSAPL
jgi:adenylate cyclase